MVSRQAAVTFRTRAACIVWLTTITAPWAVCAEDTDGLYSRLDRDLTLSVEPEGGLWTAGDVRASVGGVFRARYLDEIGIALGYDRAIGGDRADALWAGVDLRPLMLGRWAYDLQGRSRALDLLVDSIGLDLGVAWLRPGETLGAGGGFGLALGTGVELPLTWHDGTGVSLRLSVRWISAQPWDAQGTGAGDSVVLAGVGLVFRTMVHAGFVRAR